MLLLVHVWQLLIGYMTDKHKWKEMPTVKPFININKFVNLVFGFLLLVGFFRFSEQNKQAGLIKAFLFHRQYLVSCKSTSEEISKNMLNIRCILLSHLCILMHAAHAYPWQHHDLPYAPWVSETPLIFLAGNSTQTSVVMTLLGFFP